MIPLTTYGVPVPYHDGHEAALRGTLAASCPYAADPERQLWLDGHALGVRCGLDDRVKEDAFDIIAPGLLRGDIHRHGRQKGRP